MEEQTERTANNIEIEVNVSNKVTQELALYNERKDYNREDLLLKAVNKDGVFNIFKEQISSFLSREKALFDYETVQKMTDFLDLLLVRNSDFLEKYMYWLRELSSLTDKLKEIEEAISIGMVPTLHEGMIICSATDSTEDKVKRNYGGGKWKRVVNFLLGTGTSQLTTTKLGDRKGESYVTLVRDNIPDHLHTVVKNSKSGADSWKIDNAGTNNFVESKSPGQTWDEKNVYPEIAPLGWTSDTYNGNEACARYVKPHYNIPPYTDVFMWECEEVTPEDETDPWVPAISAAELMGVALARALGDETVVESNIKERACDTTVFDFQERPIANTSLTSLQAILSYDDLLLLVSDELQRSQTDARFESKNMSLGQLASIQSSMIFGDLLHIEKRYLFREVYRYLISDIQDRIFLILKKISAVRGATSSGVKYRAFPGQYIFLYKGENGWWSDNVEYLKSKYVIPDGYRLQLVNKTFVRGTSTYTEETMDELIKYTNNTSVPSELVTHTTLADSNVNLVAKNFPQHLHWSALLSGMTSIAVKYNSAGKGGEGTAMFKNDPISGGIKYSHLAGSGNYKFDIQPYGVNPPISHNNMPAYRTLIVYKVVE